MDRIRRYSVSWEWIWSRFCSWSRFLSRFLSRFSTTKYIEIFWNNPLLSPATFSKRFHQTPNASWIRTGSCGVGPSSSHLSAVRRGARGFFRGDEEPARGESFASWQVPITRSEGRLTLWAGLWDNNLGFWGKGKTVWVGGGFWNLAGQVDCERRRVDCEGVSRGRLWVWRGGCIAPKSSARADFLFYTSPTDMTAPHEDPQKHWKRHPTRDLFFQILTVWPLRQPLQTQVFTPNAIWFRKTWKTISVTTLNWSKVRRRLNRLW